MFPQAAQNQSDSFQLKPSECAAQHVGNAHPHSPRSDALNNEDHVVVEADFIAIDESLRLSFIHLVSPPYLQVVVDAHPLLHLNPNPCTLTTCTLTTHPL